MEKVVKMGLTSGNPLKKHIKFEEFDFKYTWGKKKMKEK